MQRIQLNLYFTCLYIFIFYKFIGYEVLPFISNFDSIILFLLEVIIISVGLPKLFKLSINIFFIFLAFLLVSFISYLINDNPIVSHLNGMRSYLIIFSIISYTQWVLKSKGYKIFVSKFNIFINIYAYSQLPLAVYQFMKYGAGDHVGGSLSAGYSGVMTLLLFSIYLHKVIMYSYSVRLNKIQIKAMIIYFPIIIPCFLNETKMTFFLMPLLFVLLLDFSMKNLFRNIGIAFLGISVFLIFNNIYNNVSQEYEAKSADTIYSEEFFQKYFFNENEITETTDIGRFQRFIFYYDIAAENGVESLLFGKGFGLFKGSSLLGRTEFSIENEQILSGSNISSAMMFLEGGIILSIIMLYYLFYEFRKVWIARKNNLQTKQYVFFAVIIILSLIYNKSIFFPVFSSFIFGMLFMLRFKRNRIKCQKNY